jgi:hypothetical protein
MRLLAIAVTFTLACASGHPAVRPGGTSSEDDIRTPLSRETMQELVARVERLHAEPTQLQHSAVLAALNAMAPVVAGLETPESAATARRLHSLASQLERVDPSSLQYAEQTTLALDLVLAAASGVHARCDGADLELAVERARFAMTGVDFTQVLSGQSRALIAAVQAVADVLLVAVGADPAFLIGDPTVEVTEGGTATDGAPTFTGHVERAHESLMQLSRSRWPATRQLAGRVLTEFADALAVGSEDEIRSQIDEVRFQAALLQRTSAVTFARGAWVKKAATSALSALELVLADGERSSTAAPWIARARATAQSIDDRGTLTFQRAVVQDALRSLADAFFAASQHGPSL